MYCHQCGKEIIEDSTFCQFCGAKLNPQKQEVVVQENYKSSSSIEKVEEGPWRLMAAFGLALGIFSICSFFTIVFPVLCGIPGIVLSALGKRSEINNSKATVGLVLSILGTILGICFPIFLFR